MSDISSSVSRRGYGNMIDELLRFLEIDDEIKDNGRELWALLAPHVDEIISHFYRNVQRAQINVHVTDTTIDRLKSKQFAHWAALFGSRFDEEYANSVRRIGIRHRDIDLNPLWYVAAYMMLKIEFMKVIAESKLAPVRKGHLMKTLDKYVAIDMALALSPYDATIFD